MQLPPFRIQIDVLGFLAFLLLCIEDACGGLGELGENSFA
jgi:hypothetical protein